MSNVTNQWYLEPLKSDDIFAGTFLLCFGGLFLLLHISVTYIMFKNDKEIIGFRFLCSAAIADIFILFNYAIWPGLTILFKSEIVHPKMRPWIQMYLDWVWFSMCYHYMLIAWSRFAAIRFAAWFRVQTRRVSYLICGTCYLCAFIQVLCTHFQPWYSTFYYEPSAYGMLSEDFDKYRTQGQSLFFFTFHILMMIIPFIFYGGAVFILIKHRKSGIFTGTRYGAKNGNTEVRLIIPCIFNSIVFIIGQIVITNGPGEGKWATWLVLLLFSVNSAVNPILLLGFSAIIRQKTASLVSSSARLSTINFQYSTVPGGLLYVNVSPLSVDSRKCKTGIQERNIAAFRSTECHFELLRQISEPCLAQSSQKV